MIADFNEELDTFQEPRKNQVISFTVDLDDELGDTVTSLGNKILSRRSSVVIHKSENENVEETFDQILKVIFLICLHAWAMYLKSYQGHYNI